MSSPLVLAFEIAQLLDSDPIVARQVKEHLSKERLSELLEVPLVEEQTDDFLNEKKADDALLDEITERGIPLETVLAHYRHVKN